MRYDAIEGRCAHLYVDRRWERASPCGRAPTGVIERRREEQEASLGRSYLALQSTSDDIATSFCAHAMRCDAIEGGCAHLYVDRRGERASPCGRALTCVIERRRDEREAS